MNTEEIREEIERRVERYGMAYKGILDDETIYNCKVYWRNELLDILDLITKKDDKQSY